MKWFFNANFKSATHNKAFVRTGIELDNGTMFGCQNDEAQNTRRFSYKSYNQSHVDGVVEKAMTKEEFLKLVPSMNEDLRKRFTSCFVDMSRSFRNHVSGCSAEGRGISTEIQSQVYSDIIKVRDEFFKKQKEVPEKVEKKWVLLDTVDINDEKLMNEIIDACFSKKDEVVNVRGTNYILKYQDEKKDSLAIFVEVDNSFKPEPVDIKIKPDTKYPIIPTKKMAYCIDNNDLMNFNLNELYEIVRENGNFIVVKDNFDEERIMFANRFKVIKVEEELVF